MTYRGDKTRSSAKMKTATVPGKREIKAELENNRDTDSKLAEEI